MENSAAIVSGLADAGLGMAGAAVLMNRSLDGPKGGPKTQKMASNAPKRFKSSFIFFSMAKHKQIKEEMAKQDGTAKTTNITKTVSDAWRNMDPEERAKYDEMARKDKARYDLEKANYKAPPGTTSTKKIRDPNAPKRPMSAFLAYANSRRGEVKAKNPNCSNGEISKILSNMWKEAPDSIKQKYRDDEAALWAAYKEGMVEWKKKNDGRKRASKMMQNGKKKKKKKSKEGDELLSAFGGHHFPGISGGQGLDTTGNPNQDEMMAASALRGVRGTTNYSIGPGQTSTLGFDGGVSQQHFQQASASGGYGQFFGMNGVNAMNPYGTGVTNNGGAPVTPGPFPQEMGNTTNRALLEMGFPYQQYNGYPLGNQAMLMAQALRGAPSTYPNQLLGLSGDQQPPLSQLASLAGTQNGTGSQGVVAMGMNMGMGNMMDNSAGNMGGQERF